MRLNDFATLERGEQIVVHLFKGKDAAVAHDEVFVVTGEPFEGNTLVPATSKTSGKKVSVYFRDVLKRATAQPTNSELTGFDNNCQ